MTLSPASGGRFDRLERIAGWDREHLAAARILVAGAGAIGNEVLRLLAQLGIGHVLVVDFDTVELLNLPVSPLFRESDIGRPKARAAAEAMRALSPDVSAEWFSGDLEFELGLGVVRSMDLVIGCLDSLGARLALNLACRRAGVPWLNGAIEINQVEVTHFGGQSGPCFECGMSAAMWARRAERFSCGGLRSPDSALPVPTTAITASLAGALLVNEAAGILLGGPGGASDSLQPGQKISLQTRPYHSGVYALQEQPGCLAHELWAPVRVIDDRPAGLTAIELLVRLDEPDGQLKLGWDLLTGMTCSACGAQEPMLRPLESAPEELIHCPACGEESRSPVSVAWIDRHSPAATLSLAWIGVPDYAILEVAGTEKHRVQLSGEYRPSGLQPDAVQSRRCPG